MSRNIFLTLLAKLLELVEDGSQEIIGCEICFTSDAKLYIYDGEKFVGTNDT